MILDLGMIEYEEAWKIQRELVAERRLGRIEDSIMVVEHPAVVTIGRSGSRKNLLVEEDTLIKDKIRVMQVDRGGDITFHSPGQLVAYPVIDLKKRVRDLHNYLRGLEGIIIAFLEKYGVKAVRRKEATGVWVKDEKIAFIGVAAKDWVTYHGLSININNNTGFFSMMNPCGMEGLKVTSLGRIIKRAVPMAEAKKMFLREFNEYCPAMA